MSWQEAATYFSLRTATMHLCLVVLLCLFLTLPFLTMLVFFSLSLLYLSVWFWVCPSLLPWRSFAIHCCIFLFFLLALFVSVSLFCLSVFQSHYLFCPTLPYFFSQTSSLWPYRWRLQIFKPLDIYTPNVIILSLSSGLSILQPFTLLSFFVSSLSLPFCLFLCLCTLSSVLQVPLGGCRKCRGEKQKRRRPIHSLYACEYDTGMLVINAAAYIWYLVVLVMYDLYGVFPHTGQGLSY